jgi:adenine-specific DNA-methyltransferase
VCGESAAAVCCPDANGTRSRSSALGVPVTELNFKGKEFVYNHHLAVPFRPLVPHPKKGIGPVALDGNLIIHGDNLHALKALLPMYAGKVDCIFIDPPYNTGNEGWSYNDNVNSPLMKEWLAANPIGIEDGLRHDKWCAMMWPRLRLLYELLSEQGVIFVCIDDNEISQLRILLNEMFGVANWIGTIVWKNVTDNNPTRIAIEHEYIVCFAKNKQDVNKVWKTKVSAIKDKLVQVGKELIAAFRNDIDLHAAYAKWFKENKAQLWPLDRYKYIDRMGVFTGSQSVHNPGREGYRYDVMHPDTKRPCKQPLMGYRFPFDTMQELLEQKRIIFGEDENKIIELKLYAHEFEDKLPSVIELDGRIGAYELREIFPGQKKVFDFPKPSQLVEKLLSFVVGPEQVVLDSFAGSGTTAHAILSLNAQDNGKRKFLLVECEAYADTVTRERVDRVSKGIPTASNETLRTGLSGTFTYCTLGEPVELDKILQGQALPEYAGLGSVLFHMATNRALDTATMRESGFYLGSTESQHVWLIYRPDVDWLKSPEAALTLSRAKAFAATDPERRHLVFAPARFVSQKMLNEQNIPVEFVPLPFALYRIERS